MGLFTKKHAPTTIPAPRPAAAPAGHEIDLAAVAPEPWRRYREAAATVASVADRLTAVRREIGRIEGNIARLEAEIETGRDAVAVAVRARLLGQPVPADTGRDLLAVRAELDAAQIELGVAREVRDELRAEADVADDAIRLAWNSVMDTAARALTAQAREAAGRLLGQAFQLRQREFNDGLPFPGEAMRFDRFLTAVFDGCSVQEIPGLPWRPVSTAAPGGKVDHGFEVFRDDDDGAAEGF